MPTLKTRRLIGQSSARVKGFRFSSASSASNAKRFTVKRPAIARRVDHVVIYESRLAALMRSALLASDLALLPVQPSPFDGWASAETLTLIDEARTRRRLLVARFVPNHCTARTVIASETAAALADHDPPLLRQRIGQRVAFADAAKTGRLVWEIGTAKSAARDANGFANEVGRIGR
jgi:chromosome partitioning protein